MARGATPVLEKALVTTVEGLGYEFVGHEVVPQGRRMLLRVYIDAPGGIKIRDCEIVSRQLSSVLDVEDPFSNKYTLEVSSPGLNRPLFTREQYQKFIGSKVRIRLRLPRNGQRNFNGVLQAVTEDELTLQQEDAEPITINFREIEKGHLQADI